MINTSFPLTESFISMEVSVEIRKHVLSSVMITNLYGDQMERTAGEVL